LRLNRSTIRHGSSFSAVASRFPPRGSQAAVYGFRTGVSRKRSKPIPASHRLPLIREASRPLIE
jgi:hypothetical protein